MRDCTSAQHPWTDFHLYGSSLLHAVIKFRNVPGLPTRQCLKLDGCHFSPVNVRSTGLTSGCIKHACKSHMQDPACLLHPV